MLTIVFLRPNGLLLTKKPYLSWRDIQDEYDEYMASLGPWGVEDVINFLQFEYPTDPPFTEEQVWRFVESDDLRLFAA